MGGLHGLNMKKIGSKNQLDIAATPGGPLPFPFFSFPLFSTQFHSLE
jgi:hypothetical protein